ncbi:hypothetical protein VTJ83DRAFT_6259 [Remersonia thermophila]|uniref:Uncharacterized protein n=1 Tax=Remersonia thermophila TaxID=72144 RepID=A0ABR4D557_9PEZI
MSSTPAASSTPLPHRSVASIRAPSVAGQSGPTTPLRSISSSFGSPSSLRADDEIIIVEFGTRKLQVGFSGDPAPRGCIWFGPDQLRRAGDFRDWQPGYRHDWRSAAAGGSWGRDYELWRYDVRSVDLGLVGDKVERALRDAFTKYMLIDSRPRRMVWVLPSSLPVPLLSAALDSVFTRFQPPTISLLSSPLALAVGAGVRSALVVDLGWNETVVTSIYEYREVATRRSIRGGRMLVEQTHNLLAKHLPQGLEGDAESQEHVLSFEECSDIAQRLVWCRPRSTAGQEEREGQEEEDAAARSATVRIPLTSWLSPTTLELPFDDLSEPCETAFFDAQYTLTSFDDDELPLHLLVYRSLLQLSLDVRATCMSRIIFTGGCSAVLGLRKRIFDEVSRLVQQRGWDPVRGKAVEQLLANPKLQRAPAAARRPSNTPAAAPRAQDVGEERDGVWHDRSATPAGPYMEPETDPIEEQLKRGGGHSDQQPPVRGELRAIESVGAWSGASLATHLKTMAVATIDREVWLLHGAAGASKPNEVDHKVQRQSLGPGGLMRGSASGGAWTLGVWGAV